MKVWELMALLSKQPAGAEVYASRDDDSHTFSILRADVETMDDGSVQLIGDGSEPEDESIPK